MQPNSLNIRTEPPIAVITLDRPGDGNTVTERLVQQLEDALDQAAHDDAIRVVVLTGAGDAFCRGTDSDALRGGIESLDRLRAAGRIACIEKPVIAAINGDALDQGLELALACDLRIASEGARLGLTQVGRGLIPWDSGTQRLPRLVGRSRALEMLLTSRVLDAAEALEMGLVNEVVQPGKILVRAREVAAVIAAHGPIAARFLKEAVAKGLDMTLEQGLRLEADLNFILQSTADRAEGIASFLQRRNPTYRGE